jgi:hypothetical protein
MEKNGSRLVDLGWANSWREDPPEVIQCKTLGHKPLNQNLDSTWHGLHNMVICMECGYQYHYDSSG